MRGHAHAVTADGAGLIDYLAEVHADADCRPAALRGHAFCLAQRIRGLQRRHGAREVGDQPAADVGGRRAAAFGDDRPEPPRTRVIDRRGLTPGRTGDENGRDSRIRLKHGVFALQPAGTIVAPGDGRLPTVAAAAAPRARSNRA